MDLSLGEAAGAEGSEAVAAMPAQRGLGHDATRRIAGAQEQDVIGSVGHLGGPFGNNISIIMEI